MPLYEFKCERCGKVIEELVCSKNVGTFVCTKCSGKMHKVPISVPGRPVFKGIGFYQTDYARKEKG